MNFVYVPEDKLWYIDMPWEGDRYNLAMVAGSDKLLDRLSDEERENHVTLEVLPRDHKEDHPGYIECVQTAHALTKGSFYDVNGLEGFDRDIWICPVTLCVLGHYPKYIYIKALSFMDQLLRTRIDELEMSEATTKVLHDANIYTLGDLIQLTRKQMLYLPGSNLHISCEIDDNIGILEWRKEDDPQ